MSVSCVARPFPCRQNYPTRSYCSLLVQVSLASSFGGDDVDLPHCKRINGTCIFAVLCDVRQAKQIDAHPSLLYTSPKKKKGVMPRHVTAPSQEASSGAIAPFVHLSSTPFTSILHNAPLEDKLELMGLIHIYLMRKRTNQNMYRRRRALVISRKKKTSRNRTSVRREKDTEKEPILSHQQSSSFFPSLFASQERNRMSLAAIPSSPLDRVESCP